MQGYVWAKTSDDELFVVLIKDGKGYVPGVGNAIDLGEFDFLEPVAWPTATTQQSRNSLSERLGAPAAGATRECVILPFAANG